MDIPTKCWYCEEEAMVTDEKGAYCADCGATWSPPIVYRAKTLDGPFPDKQSKLSWSPGAGALVRDLNTGELKHPSPED